MKFENEEIFEEKEDKRFNKKKKDRLHFMIGIAGVLAATAFLFIFVVGLTRVSGSSMEPNYHDGQYVFYLKTASYTYGDVVGVKMTNGKSYIKRVIGMPGDVIDIRDGEVYRNGGLLEETYIQGKTYAAGELVTYPLTVEEGTCFVMGDNREHSDDSRAFGAVAFRQVLGKVLGN